MIIPSEIGVRFLEAMDIISDSGLVLVVRKRRNIGSPQWLAYLGNTTRVSEASYKAVHRDYYWAIIGLCDELDGV